MTDKIRIGDKWYVAVTGARAEENPQVIKNNDTFAMFDRHGDIGVLGAGEQGLYHDDTRYLSHLELRLSGARPLHLISTVKEDNSLLVVELMNPDLPAQGQEHDTLKGTLHLFRAKLLWEGSCYEHVRLTNHGTEAASVELSLHFEADHADMFEVRGMPRKRHGQSLPAQVEGAQVRLSYEGLDGVRRETVLRFEPAPQRLSGHEADYALTLAPGEEAHLYCTVSCESSARPPLPLGDYQDAYRRNTEARHACLQRQCGLETSNPLVNLWLDRSAADLAMLTSALPTGPYPYAGVPWYATTFGRDGLLTAYEMLWIDPSLARGVLAFLASMQAESEDPQRDAEPGKILHEARRCETANTHEVPFGRYYGTVDATPLFVSLAGAYWWRSGDLEFARRMWPHVLRALEWIDRDGDRDGDGFVEYARRNPEGLVQQGWKDSHDSVFHADGRMAAAPIALCEVQGYVYEAKLWASRLAAALDDPYLAQELHEQARVLRERFQQQFWCEELGLYAIALDGDKRPCRVATSNAGHALWTGIASPEHARRMAARLLEPDFFSGWGIRTVAAGQARYNPMSYHNGSIWPHDNALIAAGMARYGHTAEALQVFTGLFEASLHFEQHRLPELFCGFPRRASEGPTLYPVACSPQAWASATVFSLIQSCLGLDFHAETRELALRAPRLPAFIDWMKLRQLSCGEHGVDLLLRRYENNVGIDVLGKRGDVAVTVAI